MAKIDNRGKVISFKAAQETSGDARKGAEDRRQPTPQPSVSSHRTGGYADVWLKAHTDKDALIKENLALKKHQHELEDKYQTLNPTLMERALYYIAVLGIILTLLVWAGFLVVKGL